LSNVESRALVYQGILITTEIEFKLELIKILKDLFVKDDIENAFKNELSRILQDINIDNIPLNYTNFYNQFVSEEKATLTKIKINNKIIHQSKLLNYFREDASTKNIEKDLNDLLKKVKKDKGYYFSTKDIILIESLKYDGVKILKKHRNLYETTNFNIPIDIQDLINNREMGLVLLRLVEIIGEDELKNIGTDTLYFIINVLNQLNIDPLRNKILLKVLPLKV
jgi:Asp-tRNA(Asn)/Glu-tRNA(Gln) amidotransferase C subunit